MKITKLMGTAALAIFFAAAPPARLFAQEPSGDAKPPAAKSGDAKTPEPAPPKEESSVTDHSLRIGAQTIPYKATASTTMLKDEKDEPTALI